MIKFAYLVLGAASALLLTKVVEMRREVRRLEAVSKSCMALVETRGKAINTCLLSLHSCGSVVDNRLVEVHEQVDLDGFPVLRFSRTEKPIGVDSKGSTGSLDLQRGQVRGSIARDYR